MAALDDMTAPYVAQFARTRPSLPGDAGWLGALREAAIARFSEAGLPTPADESWRYTNLGRTMGALFDPSETAGPIDAARLAPWLIAGAPHHRLVFIDGIFSAALSDIGALPGGATVTTLGEALAGDPDAVEPVLGSVADPASGGLIALNAALMRDGLVVRLADGTVVDEPIHLLHYATAGAERAAMHLRNLIVAGTGSGASVIETYAGDGAGASWTNVVTEIVAGPGAVIGHVRLQDEGAGALHTGVTQLSLDRDSAYTGFALSIGARLARNEVRAALNGAGASCALSGGSLVRGRQHSDNTTAIVHHAPHGESSQMFRNVLDDHGRTVFQGRIQVQQDAQKTDASQSSRNLLLSPMAHADTKPELRILADDVKCSHGATVGDLDREAMFYLRSRGIGADEARALLIRAFLAEIIDAAPVARDHLAGVVDSWLAPLSDESQAA